ncbi:ribose-5-phosphate isomerase B [Spiroplasma sp. TIUS-1]|uniref:ribose 5-phosphate isomerase B n=1 Tax=Spiroplasma sp. TIUS-1 TaxID=216963 RepID=UPI00139919A9|nr:ribose 5-phosphate isomerase B [Spiroplasma sp. TIUS-1]QHX35599.1 ribose-5-phosphate isomerase B [Spiroplasma sp. TIUS-1]
MKVYIGNDHTAVEMKKFLKAHLEKNNIEVIDLGNTDGKSSNYAEYGIALGKAVAKDKGSLGIAICGSGIGISIGANKVHGVRAALVYEIQSAHLARQHNDANVIALGARFIANEKAAEIVDEFLNTKFEGGRHEDRIKVLNEYNG